MEDVDLTYLVRQAEREQLAETGYEGDHCLVRLGCVVDGQNPQLAPQMAIGKDGDGRDVLAMRLSFVLPLAWFEPFLEQSRLVLPGQGAPAFREDPFRALLREPSLTFFAPLDMLTDLGREQVARQVSAYLAAESRAGRRLRSPPPEPPDQNARFLGFSGRSGELSWGRCDAADVDRVSQEIIDAGFPFVLVFDQLPDPVAVAGFITELAVDLEGLQSLGLVSTIFQDEEGMGV